MEALAYYRRQLGGDGPARTVLPVAAPALPVPAPDQPPGVDWQLQGMIWLRRGVQTLWSAAGEAGRRELARRGIAEMTARRWQLGYFPAWHREPGADWGVREAVWLPRGLVIPCFAEAQLWYLKVRVFAVDGHPVGRAEGRSKYMQVRGGRPALFGARFLQRQAVLLLAESELDALLAWQAAGDLVDVASLGGAGKRLSLRWLARLLPYRRILVVYDRDAAGQQGAQYWRALSRRVEAVEPPAEDLGAFVQQGGDLRAWLQEVLARPT